MSLREPRSQLAHGADRRPAPAGYRGSSMRAVLPLLILLLPALLVAPARGEDAPKKKAVKENRLAKERSPYLRQHRSNPVDWYPWGPEAFARAKAEDKPIFLSVGYAACHWCHVMEHESFEDEATAQLLDDVFVCVKVDREERPDIDQVYMSFVQLRTGRGGWPMTVLLTPEGKPFWGGTYLPQEALQEIAGNVKGIWQQHRKELEQTADAYAEQLAQIGEGPDVPETDDSDEEILRTFSDAVGARFDARHGGYGGAPKFPPHTLLLYLLDEPGTLEGALRAQLLSTLDGMERGGIHDQVGGGFHRYSTDAQWLLPHFEKMLYDNALLAQAYAGAFALTRDPRYRRVVERLFTWLEREMKQADGGYASSLDADTEGEEGLTYTWSWAELAAVLPPEELGFAAALFGLTEDGNFRDEATGRPAGRNIPHLPLPPADVARAAGATPGSIQPRAEAILDRLLAARLERPQPGLDDKVITGWNGLLLSAFARAGRDLEAPLYLERGRALATFLLARCRREDGTLLRFPRGSGPEVPAFCEDHVHLIEGLLDLAEATGESRFAAAAADLARRLDAGFQDAKQGGFWTTSADVHETLIAKAKETWDSPIPSDNGTAARLNLRLFARTAEPAFAQAAERTLSAFRPLMAHPRMSSGVVALLRALRTRMRLEREGSRAAVRGDVHARRGVAQVDVFLERGQARPGTKVGLVVRVTLDPGWHVNAHTPSGAELIPTVLSQAAGKVAALVDLRYPQGVVRALGGSDVALYEGGFEIRAALEIPADALPGPRKIPLVLRWQPCNEGSCQAPVELELDVPLRFDGQDGPRRHEALFR